MLGFLFRGLTAQPARGEALFAAVTAEARRRSWYVDGAVPDTLDGRFAVLATIMALVLASALIVAGKWWLFPLVLIPGYGFAWAAHFLIERNRPATFRHPLWSFMGDWKMLGLTLTGRIKSSVQNRSR